MANNNTYDSTTLTLAIKNTSYDNIIYLPTKPVLDSELNFMTDISSAKIQDFVKSKIPSGWLDASYSKGYDVEGKSFGLNTTNDPNTFIVSSTKQTPLLANVNGWLLQVGGTNISEDNKLKIILPDAPSSSARSDLVFLEVWKVSLEGDSDAGKPSTDSIYKFGNTEYGGTNLPDQIINPSMNFKTTKRVQIQYRLRIVQGPDFLTTPEGINDPNTCNAQGSKVSPVSSYPFVNAGDSLDDYGLYLAGNGSEQSRLALGTVDGYVYAIPMFRVHRRNKGAFETSNQNGASFSIASGTSDRPDGKFYDIVDVSTDVEDLRHSVSFAGFNYSQLLDQNLDDVFSGSYSQVLSRSALEGNFESTSKALYINRIATSSVANTDLLRSPAVPQRYFSDVQANVSMVTSKTTAGKTVGSINGNWVTSDKFTITSPPNVSRSQSVISSITPMVRFAETSEGPITVVNGTWIGTNTATATFTLGTNPSLTNQTLYISYKLTYQRKGDKLTKPISEMLKIKDNKRNGEEWGFIDVTDYDAANLSNRRSRKIVERSIASTSPDYAFDYRVSRYPSLPNTIDLGMGTIYSYHVNANGTTTQFVIPADIINIGDAAYVYSVFNLNTQSYINLITAQRQTNGTISVTLPSAISGVIRFDIAVVGGVMELDKRTQSIVDMGRVDFYSIKGNGTSQIVLKNTSVGIDPTEIIIGAQTEYRETSSGVFNKYNTCYVNGIRQIIAADITSESSLVVLKFPFIVPATSQVDIALFTTKTLDSTDDINIFYNYSEYKGITSKVNFGTSPSAYIESQILFHRNKIDVITNGTGAVNTAESLSKNYEPLIPKLPIVNSADYGDFTGTLHKTGEIYGGSYSVSGPYNTPYASGKMNYLSKIGVNQSKGTNIGGRFAVSTASGDATTHRLIVGSMLEMVKEDGSKNFLSGELALRIETNYQSTSDNNRITNSYTGESSNSFDLYKIEGRPLIKLNSK